MKKLEWSIRHLLKNLGLPGCLGVALLLSSVLFHVIIVQPAQKEIAELQIGLESMRSQQQFKSSYSEKEELALFFDFFPESNLLPEQIRSFQKLLTKDGAYPKRVDYKFSGVANTPLWRYQSNFVLNSDYPTLRKQVGMILHSMPNAALENIEIQRNDTFTKNLEANLQINFYYRHKP